MTHPETGLSLPGTAEQPAPRNSAAVTELLAQAGDLASRAERANRPASLVYLALGVLAITLSVLAFFAYARMSAASALQTEADRANRIDKLISRLKEFDRVNEERREELRPVPTMQTQITDAAVAAQLKTKLPPAQARQVKGPGDLTRRTWSYNDLHEESLEHVFDWIARTLRAIPGLELTGLTLRPDAAYWRVDVAFGRWERTGA